MHDRIIRRKPAAQLLGVSLPTLDRMARGGLLQRIRVSERACGFRLRDIEAHIARRAAQGVA